MDHRHATATARQEGGETGEGIRGLSLSGFAVPAIFIAALHRATGLLADFFYKEGSLTGGASLVDGTVPQRILTLRVSAAGVEVASFPGALLD
jgi:hypothetical protein